MLVIAGKNNIAVNALNFFRENYDGKISVVCNKTENGIHGWQRSLRLSAIESGINEISLDEAYARASTFISLEFDKIINPKKFANCRPVNIHFSLLPKYKGMYTSVWPILNDENFTGVTLHEIDSGIDTGAIIDQKSFEIKNTDRARDIYDKYLSESFWLLKKNYTQIISGKWKSIEQEKLNSTYFSKNTIDFSSIDIDLNQTAYNIKKQIYAFSFREYQLPIVHGRRVVEAEILDDRSQIRPGAVISEESNWLVISTIDYNLKIFFDRIEEINEFAKCNISRAKELLSGLCGVNDKNEKGWSPIIISAYNGNHEILKYLISIGADINSVNINGTSVLMYAKDYAIKTGDCTIFDFLLKNGANKDHLDFSGKKLADYISLEQANFLGLNS